MTTWATICDTGKRPGWEETGQVSYRGWPLGMTGHFVSRHLPPPVGE